MRGGTRRIPPPCVYILFTLVVIVVVAVAAIGIVVFLDPRGDEAEAGPRADEEPVAGQADD